LTGVNTSRETNSVITIAMSSSGGHGDEHALESATLAV